eukprot:Amastigsp_a510841_157.p5 type:complete len:122 gc:universal Amastigsp_a510841_157:709-1074(+)
MTTSAWRSRAGASAVAPTTIVVATSAGQPSTWTPRSIFTMSPAAMSSSTTPSSPTNGELCPRHVLRDTHVGNATPFLMAFPLTFFVYTLPASSSILRSPSWQIVATLAPTTQRDWTNAMAS